MEQQPTPDPNLDSVPIIEDDQQLYDWGIEHRLDQYYGEHPHPHTPNGTLIPPPAHFQYPPHGHPQTPPKTPGSGGYVLPDNVHQQQENGYLTNISEDQKPIDATITANGKTALPVSPAHTGQIMAVKSEPWRRNFNKPLNIKPSGVPGRRPILPTVDMDANEVLKVRSQ